MRSVYDPLVANILPGTVAALKEWDGEGLPPEAAYAVAAQELRQARKEKTLGRLATRLNRQSPGLRSAITRTGRKLQRGGEPPYSESLPAMHPAWGQPELWRAIVLTGSEVTPGYYLNALDLQLAPGGKIVPQPEDRRIYRALFVKTIWVSLVITLLCLAIGYPVAWFIAHAPPRQAKILLVLVLLPFWTSLLVRTTSWIVLLQQQGVVNDLLVWMGALADDQRLTMIHNMTGTLVAMTHVLLPFMILPLYSVMSGIPSVQMQAAASLGAPLAPGLLAGLSAPIPAGGGRRVPVGVHPRHRLLHHPGPGGRSKRPTDLKLHRLPHADLVELEPGRRLGLHPVHRRDAAVPAVRPRVGAGSREVGGVNGTNWPLRLFCGLAFLFLVAPVLIIIPLSFNAEPYFTFTRGMLALEPEAYSMRWYEEVILGDKWRLAARNTALIGFSAAFIATVLGTLAALGPVQPGDALAARRHRVADLAHDRAYRHRRRWHVFLLFGPEPDPDLHGHHPVPRHPGGPLCGDHGDRVPGGFQPRSGPGRRQPGSRAGALFFQGAVAPHQPWGDLRRLVRLRRLPGRGGGDAVHGGG